MKTLTSLLILTCGALAIIGCGKDMAFLVRPVSADQRLRETVIKKDSGWYSEKIALIDVSGVIVNQRMGGLFGGGENPVSLFTEKLDAAENDSNVKAVILRINSPGGTVQATEAMYQRLQRFRKTGKPVVAHITDMGASGGYYLACGAERITCQPSTITGSIGVLIQTINFADTMRMIGVRAEAITSGDLKTMGSPLKHLTDDERDVFRTIVDEFYEQFVQAVADGREKLSVEQVKALADGRVYTGRQALAAGLVDGLSDIDKVIESVKAKAGLKRVKVVMYHRPYGHRANAYSASAAPTPVTQINFVNLQLGALGMLRRPQFLYLWSTDLTRER